MDVDSLEFFYNYYVGITPDFNEQVHKKTQGMIHHLFTSHLPLEMILEVYDRCAKDGYIAPENLPRDLWSASNLINHEDIYLHKELVLRSEAPSFNGERLESVPYFFENKEFYSTNNLLDYIYKTLNIPDGLQDKTRDSGYLGYKLKRYEQLDVPVLDYILFMVDETESEGYHSIRNLENFEEEVLSDYKSRIEQLKERGLYKIVWRAS